MNHMYRDSFYKQIVNGLSGTLDGNLFDACVNDLLSDTYPSLVPISGGGDAGMDGTSSIKAGRKI